jgi:hypothetical protein
MRVRTLHQSAYEAHHTAYLQAKRHSIHRCVERHAPAVALLFHDMPRVHCRGAPQQRVVDAQEARRHGRVQLHELCSQQGKTAGAAATAHENTDIFIVDEDKYHGTRPCGIGISTPQVLLAPAPPTQQKRNTSGA